MAFKFNPLTGNLDLVGSGGGGGSGPFTGITGTPNEFAYFDGSGNGTSDSLATRLSNAALQTEIASNTYAQLNVNDGISSEAIIQADNIGSIGNAITLTFDGVIDVDQAILNWNTANPANTCSLIGGTGTIIVPAGSPSLAGGGKAGISMGAVTLPVGVLQGNMQYAQDDTSGAIGFNLTGNFATVFGRNQQGVFNGGFSSAGVGFISASPETVELLLTNFMGQASGLTAEIGLIGINANNSGFVIDDVNSVFSLEDNATSLIIPFGLTASIGDVLAVTGSVGQDYTLGFVPSGGGGSPGGSDTNIQYNSGGTFAGSGSLTWNESNLRFSAGDLSLTNNGIFIDVADNINRISLNSPTGDIVIGDNNNVNNNLKLIVSNSVNSANIIGYLPVNAGFANIIFTGTGLDSLVPGGTWFGTSNATYNFQIVANNRKAFVINGDANQFQVGDSIQNDSNPLETATVVFSQSTGTLIGYIITDQGSGVWGTPPASVTITSGVNVGYTATVNSFENDTDVFSYSGPTSNYPQWPMSLGLAESGITYGWSSLTGNTIGDSWSVTFLANPLAFLNGDWGNGVFYIGLHQGIPQNIAPKGMEFQYNTGTPSYLKIGNVAQNGTVLSFGQNSNDGMMYLDAGTNDRFLDIQPGNGIYELGDISGAGNSSSIKINDVNERITLNSLKTAITLQAFDNDTAAGVGGLVAGELYQTTGSGAGPVFSTAGVVMVKQ